MSRQLLRSLGPLDGASPSRLVLARRPLFVTPPAQLLSIRTIAATPSASSSSLSPPSSSWSRTWPSSSPLSVVTRSAVSSQLARPSRRLQSSSSSSQQQQFTRPEEDADDAPDKLPLTQRIKALSKKYGWWAVGVYTCLSLLDFGIAFALVQYLGMARVQKLERSVKRWVKETTGWSWAEEELVQDLKQSAAEGQQEIKRKGYDSAFWAQVAIAYGIHKTLFLPFRIAATTAILPKFVKFMTKHGWAGRGARGVKEKVQQVVKDRKA